MAGTNGGNGTEGGTVKKPESYIGMNFQKWCRLDPYDERKINYTITGCWGTEYHEERFTSDDECDPMMMHRIRNSTITEIRLENDEWFVTLCYN